MDYEKIIQEQIELVRTWQKKHEESGSNVDIFRLDCVTKGSHIIKQLIETVVLLKDKGAGN